MPRALPRRLAASNDGTPIDEDVGNAFGILAWVFIAGAFANGPGVEHDDIGSAAGLQRPTVTQMQDLGGKTGHLADRLFKREQLQIAGVMSQNPWTAAV